MNIFEATTKVSKIAEQKYGCSIEFIYYDHSESNSEEYINTFETIKRNAGAQFVIAQGAILVPVYIEGEIFGSIVVKDGMHVDPLNFEDLHIFLDTTLKDFIIKKESLRRIKIEESLMKAQSQKSSNVIPLFKNTHDEVVMSLKNNAALEKTDADQAWKAALFLTGGDYSQSRAIAHDIHSLLGRNSFVPYSILELNSPNLSESLSQLGKITIYVPEILDLAQTEIDEIFKYVQLCSNKEKPFFIISSEKAFDDIANENLLEPEFISALRSFHLQFHGKSNLKDFYSLLLVDPEISPQ